MLFPELCECACRIHSITVLNLFDAHLQGCVELVIGHGVSVQCRRSLRQGQREGNAASQGDLAQVHINGSCHRDAELLQHILGIPMATAIDMYLRQITLTGGIPFSLSLPKAPAALNADTMTDDQLHAALQVGIKEIQNGDTVDAASAFAQFREQHR